MKSSLAIVVIVAAMAANTAANHPLPYIASVRPNFYNFHMCNGVILSDHSVLTSARCVDGFDVNAIDVQYGESVPGNTKRNALRDIIVHPHFERETYKNNIAVLITKEKIDFIPNIIGSINMQTLPVDDGEEVTVSGWRWAYVSVYRGKFSFNSIFIRIYPFRARVVRVKSLQI